MYSPSQLDRWMTCPQSWKWAYVEGLERKGFKGIPRPVGSAIHLGIQRRWEGVATPQAVDEALAYYEKEWQTTKKEMTPEDYDKVEQGKWQVWAGVGQYPMRADWVVNMEAFSSEEEIVVDMGRGRGLKCFLDRLVQTAGGVWVWDLKTTGWAPELVLKQMKIRQQFKAYVLVAEKKLGVRPQGVVVDLISKPRVYVRKDGTVDEGKVVAKFHQEPFHVGDEDVEDFTRRFHWIVDQMEEMEAAGWAPKNDASCLQFNRPCDYWELCARPSFVEATKETLYTVREREETMEVME